MCGLVKASKKKEILKFMFYDARKISAKKKLSPCKHLYHSANSNFNAKIENSIIFMSVFTLFEAFETFLQKKLTILKNIQFLQPFHRARKKIGNIKKIWQKKAL
jgi:hypothetical protein